jgi:hypothetical protein
MSTECVLSFQTLPKEIQITYKKTDSAKVTCSLGDGLLYTFNIFMPKIKSKMRCEIFSPRGSDNEAIFVLSKPTTTIGKNFMIKEISVPWILDAYNGGDKVLVSSFFVNTCIFHCICGQL